MISYKDFLIQNTQINAPFYNDFFSMFDENKMLNSAEFLVNHEKLQKWLKLKDRKMFIEQIKTLHILNKDYIITYPNKNTNGGHNKELLFLTIDCALLTSIKTGKKGYDVGKYFIEVNKTLLKYKDIINNKLTKKINLLLNNQTPKIDNSKMYIYVLKALNTSKEDTFYKIGKTTNIYKRINTYNSGLANNNSILFYLETTNIEQTENCLKNILKDYQYRPKKEIYNIDLDTIIKLTKLCNTFITNIKGNINKIKNINVNDNFKLLIQY
jgi:phage anti-repressor protein